MAEKYGIKNLKKCVVFMARGGEAIEEALQDGQITFGDAYSLGKVVPATIDTIGGADHLDEELKDLSEAEMVELKEYFAKELDLKNDEVELLVEKSIHILGNLGKVIKDSRDLYKAITDLKKEG